MAEQGVVSGLQSPPPRFSLATRAMVFYGTCFPDHPRKWWVHGWLRKMLRVEIEDCESRVKRRGLWWSLNPADYAHADLFWHGAKYPWEMYHLGRLLPRGCTVIDAGANFGYCSIVLAKGLKKQCRFVAIEPQPENFARLLRHVKWNAMNDVVQCREVSLSDAPGVASMRLQDGNSGHAQLVHDPKEGCISVTTLDAVVTELSLNRLDALLLDVEGYEDRALCGAAKTLDRFRPIVVVELWPPVMRQQGTSVHAVARFLEASGYRAFFAKRRRLLPMAELPADDRGVYAFYFHKDHIPPTTELG